MAADSTEDDVALVRAAQHGDQEAFGVLVARHAASIMSLTMRILGPVADAEDVAQETFVAAFKALPGFQRHAKFSTWLYRIAVNKCTDSLRTHRPDTLPLDATDETGCHWEAATDTATPYQQIEEAELSSELDQHIRALPALYRESFVLRHIEGLGYDEMSTILDVHRDTLKMRVYKARTLLCESLKHLSGARR